MTPWSPTEDATLRAAFDAGYPDADIGLTLGRSASAVEQRRRRLGLARERVKFDLDALKQCAADGLTAREAAERMGAAYNSVVCWSSRHGVRLADGRKRGKRRSRA